MRWIIAVMAIISAGQAHAASPEYCVKWAIAAKPNAMKIEQIDKAYYWCLNQDENPPLVDGAVTVTPAIHPAPKPSAQDHPGCRSYRSYDRKSRTFLDYSGHKQACR